MVTPELSHPTTDADAIQAFLAAVYHADAVVARRILKRHPDIPTLSLHVAAALGIEETVARLLADDPSLVRTRAGSPAGDPLLFLCFSPFHGQNPARDAGLLATARLLLEAGADANTRDARHGVPALHGVTGARSVLPIARLLLDAGANPTDGESVFHAAEHFHEDALELLLRSGADLNATGDWGNTPLYFLLASHDVEQQPTVQQGIRWLLDHGADPNVACGDERETSLHAAARRGQSVSVMQFLVDHGADIHARRDDGASAWLLASRADHDDIAAMLASLGAETQPLSPGDLLLAACNRGDVDAARALGIEGGTSSLSQPDLRLLPEAAAAGRGETVSACIAAGFPVNTRDTSGATALHHSAIHGRATQVRMLLGSDAATDIRDAEHSSTPLGWACFGADISSDPDADYPGCVRALLAAGARLQPDEHKPQHDGVRQVIEAQRGHNNV